MDASPAPDGVPPWYVISLRPPGTHGGLRRQAARLGARVFACAPIRLVPRHDEGLAHALDCDTVLFTSPAAARFAAAASGGFVDRPGRQWLAVGAGTAAVLARHGAGEVRFPTRMDADGVLAMAEMQRIEGRRVGLVTAPGGRDLLAAALQARGARAVRADVYRREPVVLGRTRLQRLARLPRPAVLLVSSGEALASLLEQLPGSLLARLQEDPVVVSSERLAGVVAGRGFRRTQLARSARPAELLAAAHAVARGIG